MTLSIIAKCEQTGHFGVAAATAVPAVGKLLAHASSGHGAVATQAKVNPYLGIDGLRLLEEGKTAQQVVDKLIGADELANCRQLAVVDGQGRSAVWTGEDCKDWAGAISGEGFSVQGNRLVGPDVVEQAAKEYERMKGEALVDRLMRSLSAGINAGGDRLGERSATIYIAADEEYPLWDIRIDEHHDPISELMRLRQVFELELLPHIRQMPTRKDPSGRPGEFHV